MRGRRRERERDNQVRGSQVGGRGDQRRRERESGVTVRMGREGNGSAKGRHGKGKAEGVRMEVREGERERTR